MIELAVNGEFDQPHLKNWFAANTPSHSAFHWKCSMEDTGQSYLGAFPHAKEHQN